MRGYCHDRINFKTNCCSYIGLLWWLMGKFTIKENNLLKTCAWDLQRVLQEVIKYHKFTILHGHISEQEQTENYLNKITNTQWPDGRHNSYPSKAVDISPIIEPVDWQKYIMEFYKLAAIVKFVAKSMNINIYWRGDEIESPKRMEDLIHFELLES